MAKIFPFNLSVSAVFCFFMALCLSSCGDIQQNLYLSKDGSGRLETLIDVGELMSMARGFEDMGSDQDTFSDDMMPDTIITEEKEKDPMTQLMEKISDPAYDRDFDTTMSFISIMPDSVKENEKRMDLVEKMFIRVTSPANSADITFGFVMTFDNAKQLREIVDHIKSFSESADVMSGTSPVGMDSESFLVFDSDMKAGWIRVDTTYYSGFTAEMGMGQDSSMTGEDMGMVELMFGNSKLKTTIHVPGEVISCSNPNAILTKDNKVIVEASMLDVIRSGKNDGYTIHFKP